MVFRKSSALRVDTGAVRQSGESQPAPLFLFPAPSGNGATVLAFASVEKWWLEHRKRLGAPLRDVALLIPMEKLFCVCFPMAIIT